MYIIVGQKVRMAAATDRKSKSKFGQVNMNERARKQNETTSDLQFVVNNNEMCVRVCNICNIHCKRNTTTTKKEKNRKKM